MTLVPWLVWSNEHNSFWSPNRCGYTRFIERAGRYSRDEAEAICRSANWRGVDAQHRAKDPDCPPPEICFPAPEAADAIETAEKALEPFAKAGELFDDAESDGFDQIIYNPVAGPEYSLSGNDLRRARAALATIRDNR